MSSSDLETAKSLVLEGWDQLRLQRPWPPGRPGGGRWGTSRTSRMLEQTLKGLEQSPQLPAAARSVLRFQPPGNPQRRRRWDSLFKDRDLEDLTDAAETFGVLAGEDSEDDAAWYNYAVCLAWLGRNVEAVTTSSAWSDIGPRASSSGRSRPGRSPRCSARARARSNWPTTSPTPG